MSLTELAGTAASLVAERRRSCHASRYPQVADRLLDTRSLVRVSPLPIRAASVGQETMEP